MSGLEAPRSLSSLDKAELASFLNSFDTVLTDCDGVLWIGNKPIPGSIETIKWLDEMKKKIFFVSNNNMHTLDQYIEKIRALGYEVAKEQIIIPGVVTAAFLKSVGFNKRVYVVGTKSLVKTLTEEGIDCYKDELEPAATTLSGLKDQIMCSDPSLGAVFVDYDPDMNYLTMMKIVTLLKRPGFLFLAGATDDTVILHDDLKMIGPGSFLTIFESVSGKKPVVLGKPGVFIKEVVASRHPIIPSRTLMIGDMIKQDILFGSRCGFQTILVLSGIGKLEDVSENCEYAPKFYLSKLGDLLPKP